MSLKQMIEFTEDVRPDNSANLEKPEDDITENDPNTSEKLSSTKDESIIDDNRIDTETSVCSGSFYMDKDVCSWLFNEAGGKEQTKISMKFGDNDHFSYDIIDQPFHCEIKAKEGNIEFLLYIRTVFGIYKEENANIHIVFHGNGEKPTIIRQEGIGGDVAQTISYFVKIAVQLHKHISGTISESLADLNPEKEGMIVRIIDNGIVFNRVSGRKRPSMLCNSLFEGMHMDRPYLDEQANALAREHMTMEEKISLAEDGDPDYMEEVAQAYLNGADGVEQDFGKSAYWWEKLAETGDPSAQFNTGLFYAKGCGVERDFKIAADWMRKAAENGDDDATNLVKSYEEAQENLSRAEAGDAAAQAEIAKLYTKLGGSLEQFSTDRDYEEAFLWAKRSADQGNPEGLYCLALCYEHGRGTEIDYERATQAYKKAADMKHAPSQWNLACQYLRGFSVSAGHEVEGLMLAYESAAQGYELAINGLERSGNTVEKIIESYEDPERIVTLEATQYEGRADRCERMKVGDELTYKLTKDRQGQDALELFFKGGSVGLAYQHSVGKIIALLKMKKVELKVTVRTCTPKSKRGPRARNADVTLNMILSEIRNETPEEREKRLAREAAKRKEAEEKTRIEAEKRRVEEEARKKAEEEAKEKRRERAESGALELAKEARRSYKRLEETWQDRIEEHQTRASSKTFSSIDEVIRDMRRIVLDRDRYGTRYDDLIKDVDRRGREYVKDGCSSIAVNAIRDAIAEIIDESSALDIDFSTTGVSTEEIGSTKFEVSQSSKSIQKWWNSKYENMPEVQAEKRKKRLTDDLRTAQQVVTETKKKRSELDLKEKTLEQDISLSEHNVEDLESSFDASKSRIESDLTTILQGLQEKIDAIKAEKAATEKTIADMQAHIAGLSFFKFGLKKDLTQKVESARAELPRFTEDIRRIEAEYEEAKRKCSSDIDSLQKKIEDEKRTLSGKKNELAALPDKKMELDAKVEAAIKQVEDLKKRIENL